MSEHLSSKKDEINRYDIVTLKNNASDNCLKQNKIYMVEDIYNSKKEIEYLVEPLNSKSDLLEGNLAYPLYYLVSKEKIEKVSTSLSYSSDEE